MLTQYLIKRQGLKNGTCQPDPPRERKAIPKVSEKKKQELKDQKVKSLLDKEVYLELWAASPHRCFQCGKSLGKELLTMFCHHLLAKSKYPEFRHTLENLVLLCPDHHQQAETDLDKVPKVLARKKEVEKILLP